MEDSLDDSRDESYEPSNNSESESDSDTSSVDENKSNAVERSKTNPKHRSSKANGHKDDETMEVDEETDPMCQVTDADMNYCPAVDNAPHPDPRDLPPQIPSAVSSPTPCVETSDKNFELRNLNIDTTALVSEHFICNLRTHNKC